MYTSTSIHLQYGVTKVSVGLHNGFDAVGLDAHTIQITIFVDPGKGELLAEAFRKCVIAKKEPVSTREEEEDIF